MARKPLCPTPLYCPATVQWTWLCILSGLLTFKIYHLSRESLNLSHHSHYTKSILQTPDDPLHPKAPVATRSRYPTSPTPRAYRLNSSLQTANLELKTEVVTYTTKCISSPSSFLSSSHLLSTQLQFLPHQHRPLGCRTLSRPRPRLLPRHPRRPRF